MVKFVVKCWQLPFGLVVAAAGLCAVLAGCASPYAGAAPGASAASGGPAQAEPMTAFDEPEVRRRARIRLELASTYFEQGKTAVALDELKQTLAIDPSYADAYNLRGLIYMRMNEYALAEDGFRRAVALSPRDGSTQHNYGWLLCQQKRYAQADTWFAQAVANPAYTEQAKTRMAQGLCQMSAGQLAQAEHTFVASYEMDPGNPITAYNLAQLLYQRADFAKAQFYIRRLNNSEYANAESLWLGIKVERQSNDRLAMGQLSEQLQRRFPSSKQWAAFERGAFNE